MKNSENTGCESIMKQVNHCSVKSKIKNIVFYLLVGSCSITLNIHASSVKNIACAASSVIFIRLESISVRLYTSSLLFKYIYSCDYTEL